MKTAALACAALLCSFGAANAQDAAAPAQSAPAQIQTQTIRNQTAPSAPTSAPHAQGGIQIGSSKCKGPINVASDNFVGNFDTKVGNYLGNVIVTRAECKLRADKVTAEADEHSNLTRLIAIGNVVFDSSSGTATGDNGVYELGPATVTLTGKKVVLVKGKDVMRGTVLVVDMNTGLAHLTAKGMQGNRVTSSFLPKPDANDGAAPKTKAKAKDNADN